MPKFEVVASHRIHYLHCVRAESLEEAIRMIVQNEHENGDLVDESEKRVERSEEVEYFHYEEGYTNNQALDNWFMNQPKTVRQEINREVEISFKQGGESEVRSEIQKRIVAVRKNSEATGN